MSSKTKRYIALFLGTLLISLGVSLFLKADLGVDPFTLFNLSLSKQIGVSFTVVYWIINVAIVLIVLFIDKGKIYIATLLNLLMVAPFIEIFSRMWDVFFKTSDVFIIELILLSLGCVILSLGAGMYIAAQLGLAPYDLIAIIISERTNIRYRWIRMGTDAICVIVGVFLKEPFGVGTVLSAFFLGPLIEFFRLSSEQYLNIDKTLTIK